MRTMSYTESRSRYADVLGAVADDREEVIITRAGHEPVVIVSLDDPTRSASPPADITMDNRSTCARSVHSE
jgi:prevent-host-death family protein